MLRRLLLCFFLMLLCSCRFSAEKFQGFIETDPVFLNSPISGNLVELNFLAGDMVTSAQIIYKLHDQVFNSKLGIAKAEVDRSKAILNDSRSGSRETVLRALNYKLEQAQASYDLAVKRFDRAEKLKAKGAIDLDSYDYDKQETIRLQAVRDEFLANIADAKLGARKDTVKANEAALLQSQFNLKMLESQLMQMTVATPISGYILDTYYSKGEWVAPLKPVASIVDPSSYYVKFYLPVSNLPTASLGKRMIMTTLGSDKEYKTEITFISNEAAYTPPMVYADNNTSKFVYLIKAKILDDYNDEFHLGQPVTIIWE